MSTWTAPELPAIDRADEMRISSARADGITTRPVTVWVVHIQQRVGRSVQDVEDQVGGRITAGQPGRLRRQGHAHALLKRGETWPAVVERHGLPVYWTAQVSSIDLGG